MMEIRGKRVLVVGLARSGLAAVSSFVLKGATVTVTDSRPAPEFKAHIPDLLAQKIGVELGAHRVETFLAQDLIVVSPGVPWDLPELRAARERQIPVVSEVEVASWFLKGTLVGVTGTNGKTTTTTLIGKILEASGFPSYVGGNIGIPLITVVDEMPEDSILVAELSSFQLEAIQHLHPHVAVLLNITPNHLDRHSSFEAYRSAKAQIFRNQTERDYAILNADDSSVMGVAPAVASTKVFFSRTQDLPDGVMLSNGSLIYRVRNLERPLLHKRDVRLRGDFNLENVLAAAAVGCVLGADFEAIRQAVCEFRGVEHRLEYVRDIRGVQFYNDSKATSVDATAKALSAFDQGVHLILGGKDKGAPYEPLRPWIESRVKNVFLIGAAAERIGQELNGAGEFVQAGDLETAVRLAFERALSGDVVLLAPACASFDQFRDFEHRGQVFKEIVERLARQARGPTNSGRELGFRASGSTVEAATPARQPAAAEAQPPASSHELQRDERAIPESASKPLRQSRPSEETPEKPAVPVRAPEVEQRVSESDDIRPPSALEILDSVSLGSPPEPINNVVELPIRIASESAADRAPEREPETPKIEITTLKQLDSIALYEASGEEVSPLEDGVWDFPTEQPKPSSPSGLRPLEEAHDEPLPFEYVPVGAEAESQEFFLTAPDSEHVAGRGTRKAKQEPAVNANDQSAKAGGHGSTA